MFEDNYISMPFEGGGGGPEPFSAGNFLGSGDMGSGLAGGFGFGESPSYINEGGGMNPMQMQAQRSPTMVDLSQSGAQQPQQQAAPQAAPPPPTAAAPSGGGTQAALSKVVQAAKAAQTSLPPVQPMDAIAPTAKLPTPQELGLRGSIDPSAPQRGPDMAALASRAASNQPSGIGLRGSVDEPVRSPQPAPMQPTPTSTNKSVADMMPGAEPWQIDQVERQLKGTPKEAWGDFVPVLAANAGYERDIGQNLPPVQALDNAPQRGVTPPAGNYADLNSVQGAGQMRAALMTRVMRDYNLSPEQAAGVVGNLSHETGGFRLMQEARPLAGRGGWGLAQWTGPRRREFEAFAQQNGGNLRDFNTQYSFLDRELRGQTRGAWSPNSGLEGLRGVNSTRDATAYFSRNFERPGIPHMGSRMNHAEQALADYWRYSGGTAATTPSPVAAATFNPAAIPAPAPVEAPLAVNQHILSDSLGRRMQDSDVDNFFAQLRRR